MIIIIIIIIIIIGKCPWDFLRYPSSFPGTWRRISTSATTATFHVLPIHYSLNVWIPNSVHLTKDPYLIWQISSVISRCYSATCVGYVATSSGSTESDSWNLPHKIMTPRIGDSGRTSQRMVCFQTNRLMLYWNIIPGYCKNYTKHINTLLRHYFTTPNWCTQL